MSRLRVLDLFSGIGGFSLGLERTGHFRTLAFCEIRSFQKAVLRKHWPDVDQFDDIKLMDRFDCDVICGGFPCQPFSTASRGRKVAENLWPEMNRIVGINEPKYVIAENVLEGPIENAAEDLRRVGYRTTIRNISADVCGAPHVRSRWWLIAHTHDESQFQRAIDAEVAKLPELCEGVWGAEAYLRAIRIPNGVSTGLDEPGRIALGNTVLPFIPQAIGNAIHAMSLPL